MDDYRNLPTNEFDADLFLAHRFPFIKVKVTKTRKREPEFIKALNF